MLFVVIVILIILNLAQRRDKRYIISQSQIEIGNIKPGQEVIISILMN